MQKNEVKWNSENIRGRATGSNSTATGDGEQLDSHGRQPRGRATATGPGDSHGRQPRATAAGDSHGRQPRATATGPGDSHGRRGATRQPRATATGDPHGRQPRAPATGDSHGRRGRATGPRDGAGRRGKEGRYNRHSRRREGNPCNRHDREIRHTRHSRRREGNPCNRHDREIRYAARLWRFRQTRNRTVQSPTSPTIRVAVHNAGKQYNRARSLASSIAIPANSSIVSAQSPGTSIV